MCVQWGKNITGKGKMTLVLVFIFNWWVLFLMVNGVLTFVYPATSYGTFLMIIGSFLTLSGWAFIINSNVGECALRVISEARPLIFREKNKLMPMIQDVQQAIQKTMGFASVSVHVLILDSPLPNAFVLGRKTLIISRMLYETISNEELKAVIAHEFGHIYSGESVKRTLVMGLNGISFVLLWIIHMVVQMIGHVSERAQPKTSESLFFSLPIKIIVTVIRAVSWFFEGILKMGNKSLHLICLHIGRDQEFKADDFAIKAGFGPGLLSFLEKIKNLDFEQSTGRFFDYLYASHPKTIVRIGRLENRINGMNSPL